jgi:hypothetical protein
MNLEKNIDQGTWAQAEEKLQRTTHFEANKE